jgi:hypothetical protein
MSKHCIAVLSLLAAGTAFAEGPIDYPPYEPWTSTSTRAEVRAEMFAARERGEIAAATGEDSGSAYLMAQLQSKPSTLTRAQVRAEMFAARERGEIEAFNGEDSGSAYLARREGGAGDQRLASSVLVAAGTPR